jgi:geranylgeranyl diphosphate synthase type I
MSIVPPSLLEVADRVEVRLRALLDGERARWSALDPELDAPYASLQSLVLSGGKRLRPAFAHWGFVGAGGDPDDPRSADAGAAFELLHAFALFHDDVMDGSSTRRGVRTTQLTFADGHESGGWLGEARRFGEGVAILVGDLAFVYADQLLRDAPAPAQAMWDELRIELNIGQFLDIVGTAKGQRNRAAAQRISRYKSGKYTVERPLHLGAALAGRLEELADPLSAFGLPLGEAFQLRDDILGVFGDVAVTGKPVGDDLREGKLTPLVAAAAARATGSAARRLQNLGRADLDDAEIAGLQAVLVDTGAVDEVERSIERLVEQALDALAVAPIAPEARVALEELGTFVAWRDR